MSDLQWTNTPPTKPAWYWRFAAGNFSPKLVQVFGAEDADGKPQMRYSYHETPHSSTAMPKENVEISYYGPVDDPPKKPTK